jgi:trans-aconitate 2-methyltransferase
MSRWNDVQYLKFADQRTRPAAELLARAAQTLAAQTVQSIVDLGCGPGNSTALLQARWPQAAIVGVDSSSEMLQRARLDMPAIDWLEADAGSWRPAAPVDLLFANALLQWLPAHADLLPALFAQVRPGGVFAVQMPCNFDEPSHRLMRELPGPWQTNPVRVSPVQSATFYYDLLAPHAAYLDIWQTTYQHVMADADAIVEWVKGTGLRPYLDVLDSAARETYLMAYRDAIDKAYPPRSDGKRLFSFPRLFILAMR